MSFSQGLIEIYTGNGKGKTTASIGLAIRAAGYGNRILLIHFMKSKRYGESNILKDIENIEEIYLGKPYFVSKNPEIKKMFPDVVVFEPGNPPMEYVKMIEDGLRNAEERMVSGKYDMIILDEIITAVYFELVGMKKILEFLDRKPANVEIVMTGRYAPDELIERADLVTEMKEIKHPYQKGIEAREGIEY